MDGNISGQVVKPILAPLFFRVNGLYKDTYLLLLVFGRVILKWNLGIDLRGAVLVDSGGGGGVPEPFRFSIANSMINRHNLSGINSYIGYPQTWSYISNFTSLNPMGLKSGTSVTGGNDSI